MSAPVAQSFNSRYALTDFDWNFDAVPEAELVACCYWEYARESAFLLDLKKRLAGWAGDGHCPTEVSEGLNRIQEGSLAAFFYLDATLENRAFPCQWQKLPKKERQRLVKMDVGLPPPFARGGDLAESERAMENAREQMALYRAAVDKLHAAWPGHGEGTLRRRGLWPKRKPLERVFCEDGYESLMVRIAWESYTNEQIIEAFRDWVKVNRPQRYPVPSGKGHKHISQRVALERLGILRLLHRHRLVDLPKRNPKAWKRYHSLNRRWRKDAQKAVAEFHRLFPFLKDEHPQSWPPKG